jgi:type I restriction enzyme, S subunit
MSVGPLRPIGELVEAVRSWVPERDNPVGVFTYVDLSAVDQDAKIVLGARKLPCSEAPSRARQLIRAGDVLVSTVRPNLNGVAHVPSELDEATASTGFCVLRPKPSQVDGRYLYQWVKSPRFVSDMVRKATGASYPAVSDRIVCESRVPLPPLPEQRRIAEILDKADALRVKRRAVIAKLDSLTQSIFLNMFGDPATNPKVWPVRVLEEIASVITGYPFRSEEYVADGESTRLCRGANVLPGRIDWGDLACWPRHKQEEFSEFSLNTGDVVLAMDRPWISEGFKIARVTEEDCPSLLVQRVARLRGNGDLLNEFLYHLLNQPLFARHCRPTETTIPHISPNDIRSFQFPLPPVSLQREFACRIASVDTLEGAHRRALGKMDSLFTSLQHRAFRGEL